MYAVYLLFAKSLRGLNVRSTPVVFAQSAFTAAVMLVPGLLAVGAAHYHYTGVDLLMAALLGLVTTAFSFSLFMDGLHFIRVQHAEHHRLRRAGERPASTRSSCSASGRAAGRSPAGR